MRGQRDKRAAEEAKSEGRAEVEPAADSNAVAPHSSRRRTAIYKGFCRYAYPCREPVFGALETILKLQLGP